MQTLLAHLLAQLLLTHLLNAKRSRYSRTVPLLWGHSAVLLLAHAGMYTDYNSVYYLSSW